jgi:hypothetical protein
MGRILSDNSTASGAGANGLVSASTNYIAGEAVQPGQLANLGGDGLAYYALDPNGPGAALRPLAGLIASVYPYAAGPAMPMGVTGAIVGGCVLASGNAVLFYAQSGTLQFGIYNQLGVLQGAMVTVASNVAANMSVNVVPLAGGNFAFAYTNTVGSPGQPTIAVFSSAGAVVLPPTLVEAGQTASALGIVALNGGGFAVAYIATASATGRYAVYSAAGAVVQAPAATGLAGLTLNSPCGVALASLVDGGFVVAALSMAGSTGYTYFSRFNAAGVSQQSNVTANTFATSNTVGTVVAVGLSGGGFIIAPHYGPGSQTLVTTWSAAGAVVGASYTASSYGSSNYPACAIAARGTDAVIVSALSTGAQITYCNGNGTMRNQANSTQVGQCNAIAILSNGHIVVAGTGTSMAVFDASLNPVGTVTLASLGLNPGTVNFPPSCILPMTASPVNPNVPLALTLTGGAGVVPKLAAIATVPQATQKTTPIGVFSASAAAGLAVPVQFMGMATLATSFVQPFSMDANGTQPPGQRMAVVGNQAILSGIQAPSARRQIN